MNRPFLVASLVLMLGPNLIVAAELRRDIEFGKVDETSLKLNASVPDGDGPFPVVIVVHGGGWSGGDKAQGMKPLTGPLTDGNFTWFSINYRLAPASHWPACLDDVRAAIRWVKAHAAECKGDPQRIALLGYSAGGHLAAYAADTAENDTRVQAVVLCAAPTFLEGDVDHPDGLSPSLQKLFDHDKQIDDQMKVVLHDASPLSNVTAKTPPTLLIHGSEDKSVLYQQSVNYKARLDALGVPCELVTIVGGDHHIDLWPAIDASYKQKLVDWLKKTLTSDK
jgi:acetyl esterase/lipase